MEDHTPEGRIVGGYKGSDGHNRVFVLSEVVFTTAELAPPAPRAPRCGAAACEYMHDAVTKIIPVAVRILFNISAPRMFLE
jgi:hypothetical protein